LKNDTIRIALIGEPNVGKSSLLNALVGEKASIVTGLAGTTRDQIRGFVEDFEISDTPGMNKGTSLLGKHMRKSISSAVQSADIIVYVLDAAKFNDADIKKIENYRGKTEIPLIVAVNKCDLVPAQKLLQKLEKLNPTGARAIIPCSVKTNLNIQTVFDEIKKLSKPIESVIARPNDTDIYTDRSIKDLSAEIIREAIIKNTRDEIPHGVAIVITKFIENTASCEIHADIICEKQSHKPIIIGKGGAVLKKIGIEARKEIEKLMDTQVKLYTTVIVRPNWQNKIDILSRTPHA
jgi:GTP-binding protein Era